MPEQPYVATAAEPNIVDLFAGPGGLDVAAEWLGVPSVGIEWDDGACATRGAAGLRTLRGDVRQFGPADFPEATILAGGPPCQTFTVAGSGAGRRALDRVQDLVERMVSGEDVASAMDEMDDERTGLVLEPLRWVLRAIEADRPFESVVLEQVPAALPVWKAMAGALRRLGYRTDYGVLRTEQYGVPQTRRRAILVARRCTEPHLPDPTHRAYRSGVPRDVGDAGLLPWETMERTLERPGPFTVISNYGTGGDPRARGRRFSHEPAATVTGKIRRNRLTGRGAAPGDRFTSAEAGRLQTFPRDYPWSGKDIGQQIGNAIPPRLAAHVLAAVVDRELVSELADHFVKRSWKDARNPLTTDRVPLDFDVVMPEPQPAG